MRRSSRRVPLVVRMAGNNAAFAARVLDNNGVPYASAGRIAEAAQLAVAAAREHSVASGSQLPRERVLEIDRR